MVLRGGKLIAKCFMAVDRGSAHLRSWAVHSDLWCKIRIKIADDTDMVIVSRCVLCPLLCWLGLGLGRL